MTKKELTANALLVLTAAIWGFAFVAQRVGSGYVGAFTYNGVRFALGAASLLPIIYIMSRKKKTDRQAAGFPMLPGVACGIVLFIASTLQQIGVAETTAGKAGFITGFYIVLVPLFGLLMKRPVGRNIWIGVVLALSGLYVLSVSGSLAISKGDLLVLIGAVFFAVHILIIDRFAGETDSLKLSFMQFLTCSVLSCISALIFEEAPFSGVLQAAAPILYGGIGSVGVAYTLQVIAQKDAKPSHAAIIMSLEAAFGSLGGFIILHENLGVRGYVGCLLMLSGMIISQIKSEKKNEPGKQAENA
jgi:drug/metabolite transporter (DMT)-like permease